MKAIIFIADDYPTNADYRERRIVAKILLMPQKPFATLVSNAMLPPLKKPDDYRPLSGFEKQQALDLYHEFEYRIQKSTQQAYGRLHDVQHLPTPKGLTKSEAERNALQPMWDCYDIYSRAVLYLTVRTGGQFDRPTLESAQLGTHSFSNEQLEQYDWDFPASMFNYHCDLPMTVGEKYKFKFEKPNVSKIEVVVEQFAFCVTLAGSATSYVTLWDGSFKLLETTDYDDDLDRDWDGRCQYIQ